MALPTRFFSERTTALLSVVLPLIALFIFFFYTLEPIELKAQTGPTFTLSGYAWSDTIGWISLSCANESPSTCASQPQYQVTINTTTNTITGYAWSEYIGWIRFGGLSGFPGGGGDAAINTSTGQLSGWIRACIGTASAPGTCNTMTNSVEGWDGWISLSCSNTGTCGTSNYGVGVDTTGRFTTATSSWGGGTVVGWVDFSPAQVQVCSAMGRSCSSSTAWQQVDQWCQVTSSGSCTGFDTCSGAGVCAPPPPVPPGLVSFTITPMTVRKNGTATVSWNVASTTNCVLNVGGQTGVTKMTGVANGQDNVSPSAPNNVTEPLQGEVVYSLWCADATQGGTLVQVGSDVRVRVVADLQEQ